MKNETVLRSEGMKEWCEKVIKTVKKWLSYENKDEWLKNMRGMLSLVATVIATMTFQSAMNPPGGVKPAAPDNDDIKCPDNITDTNPCPGEAVLAVIYPDAYISFLVCNTICFISSLAICLLLVSGLPVNNRFFTWLLSIGMCITITSLTFTYMFGAQMVTPDPIWSPTISMFDKTILIWISLLGLIALFLTLRLIVWIVSKYCFARHKPMISDIASQTS